MFRKEIKRIYKVIQPIEKGDLQSEWNSCIKQLGKIRLNSIFKISVFVDDENWEYAFTKLSSELKAVFPDGCPALTILAQAPGQSKVSFEIGMVNDDHVQISYKSFQNISYSIIECNGNMELWASGLGLTPVINDIASSATKAYEDLVGILKKENISMNDVVRQWNYIPHILNFATKDDKVWQHYQLFNEVRKQYYNKYRTIDGYPAATGIGVAKGSVSIDICAVKTKNSIYSINNPEQVNAYQYQQDVLVGELAEGTKSKQAPQFERAKLISSEKSNTLFISGTASIKGQYTIGLNNVGEQTQTTLDLIKNLCQAAKQTAKKIKEKPLCFSYARIYIKKPEDFESVELICKKELPGIPLNFVQADICRDNLLVEIEAEISSKPEYNHKTNSEDTNLKYQTTDNKIHKE